MWWFLKKKGEELDDSSGLESQVSSPKPDEMALAWQWISYLQNELQKVNSNVRSVHAHHDARGREMGGSVSQQLSGLGSKVSGFESQLSGLKSQVSGLGSQLPTLASHVSNLGSQIPNLASQISYLTSHVPRLDVLESRMGVVEGELPKVVSALDALRSRVEQASHVSNQSSAGQRSRSSLQERVERKIHRGGKDFLKQSIRSLVQKYGRLSALQIREIIVDEQGLCSKSTLYRLLDEVEKEFSLSNEGREKVFSVLRT